jgi:molecular chaperone GrpE
VVQVEITKPEDMEKESQHDPQEDHSEIPDEVNDQEDVEEQEVPLDKMTKVQLLDKAIEFQKTAGENFDLYVRSQAEMENLKKRFQKEKSDLCKFSNESLIKQLLSVVDNLEKAIAHSGNEESLEALREGIKLTLKGLMDTLKSAGLESVDAIYQSFDPNFHQAVSEQEDSSVKHGTVIQELQKGYILNQRLIRPAMVIVSKNGD